MSSEFVESFGSAFVQWLSLDIMPYIAGAWSFIVLVTSVIVNIVMLATLKKRQLLTEPSNRLLLALIINDILSWIFLLIPTTIVSFAKSYILTEYFCTAQGIATTYLYLQTFSLTALLVIERCEIIRYKKRYNRVFGSHCKVNFLIVLVSILNIGAASVPVSGWVKIEYHFYHAACICKFKDNIIYTGVVLFLGIGFAFLVGVIGFCLALSTKHEKIKKEKEANAAVEARQKFKKNSITPKTGWADEKKGKEKDKKKKGKKDKGFLDDDHSDPFFHLMFTYIIIWAVLLGLWAPYFGIVFYDFTKSGSEIWQGYYTIGVLAAATSFAIKPIIYVAHNRHFQAKTKETLPEKMVKKAEDIRKSVNQVIDKLDKIVFKSNFRGKIRATVTAKILGRRWLMKVRNRKKARLEALAAQQGTGNCQVSPDTQKLSLGNHQYPARGPNQNINVVKVTTLHIINEETGENLNEPANPTYSAYPTGTANQTNLNNPGSPNNPYNLTTTSNNSQRNATTTNINNKTKALLLAAKNKNKPNGQTIETNGKINQDSMYNVGTREQTKKAPAQIPNLDLDWGIDESLRRSKRPKSSIQKESTVGKTKIESRVNPVKLSNSVKRQSQGNLKSLASNVNKNVEKSNEILNQEQSKVKKAGQAKVREDKMIQKHKKPILDRRPSGEKWDKERLGGTESDDTTSVSSNNRTYPEPDNPEHIQSDTYKQNEYMGEENNDWDDVQTDNDSLSRDVSIDYQDDVPNYNMNNSSNSDLNSGFGNNSYRLLPVNYEERSKGE